MSENPTKFQAIIINKCGRFSDLHKLKIDGKEITSEKFVKLLGIDIENKLNFETHIGKLCKKAVGQLNTIGRINRFIDCEERKILTKILYIVISIIVLWPGCFVIPNPSEKSNLSKKGPSESY